MPWAIPQPASGPSPAIGEVSIDATKWHSWAVEMAPSYVTAFVDGRPYWHTTEASGRPAGPMLLCMELNRPPAAGNQAARPSILQVDWVRQYPLPPGAGSPVG